MPSADSVSGNDVTVNNTGATQSLAGCYGTAEDDMWFKFTATSARHKIWVYANEYINPVLQVFSGSCGSLSTLACRYFSGPSLNDYVDADLTNLTPGTTYYYRIYGSLANNLRTNITTRITTPPVPPAHDECNGALTLTVDSDNGCSGLFSGSMRYATQSRPSCVASYYDAKDIWFKFTAVAPTQRITVTPVSFDDYAFEVFGGTCNSLTSIACVNNGSLNDPDVALLTNLTAGATYYIRLYDYYGNGSSFRTFTICVNSATQYVNNDDCSGAVTVIPSANANPGSTVDGHNIGATSSLAGCYGTAEDDVWFKFTATSTRHRITVLTENMINPVLQVFSGSCGALNPLTCQYTPNAGTYDFADADLSNLTIGVTYHYRVYGAPSNNIGTRISTNIRTFQTVLPITLTDFRAARVSNQNLLTWQTTKESANKGFVVEFSKNGAGFDSLSFVSSKASNGNSSERISYDYTHSPLGVQGRLFYRLKQIDLNGTFKYSVIVSVEAKGILINFSPNPATDFLSVNSLSTEKASYRILDVSGQPMGAEKVLKKQIDVRVLKPGVYFLEVQNNNSFQIGKFIKQ